MQEAEQLNNDFDSDRSKKERLVRWVQAYRICMNTLAQLRRKALQLVSDKLKKSDEKRIEELRNSLKK